MLITHAQVVIALATAGFGIGCLTDCFTYRKSSLIPVVGTMFGLLLSTL
jgi:hypothetical protein